MLRLRRSVGLALTGATVAVLGLFLAAAAGAKFRLALAVSNSTPAVGQPVTVVLRSGVPLDFNLKLIAVAPGPIVVRRRRRRHRRVAARAGRHPAGRLRRP